MDVDSDGVSDIVLTGYSGPAIGYRGVKLGGFGEAFVAHTPAAATPDNPMMQPVGLSVVLWDWDADGDLDLLQSTLMQGLSLYLNEGGPGELDFAKTGTPIFAGETALGVDVDANPKMEDRGMAMPEIAMFGAQALVADWDGDRLEDLLLAGISTETQAYTVAWCKNLGSRGAPRFGEPVRLVEALPGRKADQFCVLGEGATRPLGDHWTIAVGDVTGDGLVDLVLGDAWQATVLRRNLVAGNTDLKAAYDTYSAAVGAIRKLSEDPRNEADHNSEDGQALQEERTALYEAQEAAATVLNTAQSAAVGDGKADPVSQKGGIWLFERRSSPSAPKEIETSTPDESSKTSMVGGATDFTAVSREIEELPELVSDRPLFNLLLFSGTTPMWTVLDQSRKDLPKSVYDVLYIDLNSNGSLLDEGERFIDARNAHKDFEMGGDVLCVFQIKEFSNPVTGHRHSNSNFTWESKVGSDKGRFGFFIWWEEEMQTIGRTGSLAHEPEAAPIFVPGFSQTLQFTSETEFAGLGTGCPTLPIPAKGDHGKAASSEFYVSLSSPGDRAEASCKASFKVIPDGEPIMATLRYRAANGDYKETTYKLLGRC